jgi:hypothetical protein
LYPARSFPGLRLCAVVLDRYATPDALLLPSCGPDRPGPGFGGRVELHLGEQLLGDPFGAFGEGDQGGFADEAGEAADPPCGAGVVAGGALDQGSGLVRATAAGLPWPGRGRSRWPGPAPSRTPAVDGGVDEGGRDAFAEVLELVGGFRTGAPLGVAYLSRRLIDLGCDLLLLSCTEKPLSFRECGCVSAGQV